MKILNKKDLKKRHATKHSVYVPEGEIVYVIDGQERIRITEDKFFVAGKEVDIEDKEQLKELFNAFLEMGRRI